MEPTYGQIWDAGKSLNKDNTLSDAILQKIYDLHPEIKQKIKLSERACYEQLRKEAKRHMDNALTKVAESVSTDILNASYFNWKKVNR